MLKIAGHKVYDTRYYLCNLYHIRYIHTVADIYIKELLSTLESSISEASIKETTLVHPVCIFLGTPKIQTYIERLRESKIYILEISKFLSGLDSNKNGVVSKSLDNSYRNFRKTSSGF